MDRSYYHRYYAVQFTTCKEVSNSNLTRNEQLDLALKYTQMRYYADLERMVINKDLALAYVLVNEFKAFLNEVE